jgi:hypothetical protein
LCAFVSRVLNHHLVERATHVEHHRVQFAGDLGSQRNTLRGVAKVLDSERLGQALGGVDGQHDDRAAVLCGAQCHRRSGGRLSDTACAATDHDAIRGVVQDLGHVKRRWCGAHQRTPWWASASANS